MASIVELWVSVLIPLKTCRVYKRKEARMFEQANNPHYLKSNDKVGDKNADDIPVVRFHLNVPLQIQGLSSSEKHGYKEGDISNKKQRKIKRKKKSKNSKARSESEEDIPPLHVVNIIEGEMPDGARSSEEDEGNADDPHRALNIDLEEPINNIDASPVINMPETINNSSENVSLKHKSKKEKDKHRKNKDSSGHKKKHKKERKRKDSQRARTESQHDQTKDKAEYEEAPGIVTPSKERFISPITPMTPSVSIAVFYASGVSSLAVGFCDERLCDLVLVMAVCCGLKVARGTPATNMSAS
ncbi:AP-3 complex subunit delta-1 [Trichonephila clavipes]|nr:AP-3 complex subunit delta-1 [Trichonephila clavipes]